MNFFLKSTQYKNLAPNALQFTYFNLAFFKPYEKRNKKSIGEIL